MKTFKYIALIASLIVTSLFAAPAMAEYLPGDASAEDRVPSIERVLAYLQSDQVVPSRFDLRRLSADPVADLVNLANTNAHGLVVRSKAIQSLSLYTGDDRAAETMTELMRSTRNNNRLFPVVIVAYAQVLGDEATTELSQLAQNRNVDVRLAAVTALGRFGGQDGYETLLKLETQEANDSVRQRIQAFTR